jgi:hypothetical protein
MLDNMNMGQKGKSFWKKPEGVTGAIFAVGIGTALLYGAYKVLPYLVEIAENTLYLGLLVAGIATVGYVLLDPKFRNMVWFMYKSAMRAVTSAFVQIDPIGIIKTYIESLKDRREEMDGQVTKLRGEIGKLERSIAQNNEDMNTSLKMAQAAKTRGLQDEFVVHSREAGRMAESNKKLIPLNERMNKLQQFLAKMHKSCGFLIQDMENEVRAKEREYAAIKASHSAMRSALSIINGDSDKKLMFDQAMEFLQDDMGKKVGEVERFMELSTEFINNIDLQNDMFAAKGVEMLDQLDGKDFSFLLGAEKKAEPITIGRVNNNAPIPMQQEVKSSNPTTGYDKFYES